MGNNGTSGRLYLGGSKITADGDWYFVIIIDDDANIYWTLTMHKHLKCQINVSSLL